MPAILSIMLLIDRTTSNIQCQNSHNAKLLCMVLHIFKDSLKHKIN